MKNNLYDNSRPFAYISLSWLLILAIVLFPIIYTIYISLTNMNVFHWTDFTFKGADNYIKALTNLDEGFIVVLARTLIWTVVNLVLQVGIALTFALILNIEGLKYSGLYKTILMIPWAMPGYISALIWRNGIFDNQYGLFNQILRSLNFEGVDWLNSDLMAFIACLVVNLWMALPFMILMIYGGLQSIDKSYYEIAEIEGAKTLSRVTRITLPLLRPILIPAVTITAFVTFKQFDIIYLMTQQTGSKTGADIHVIITYVFEKAFVTNNYGYSSALSVLIFVIIIILTGLNQRYMRERKELN
ncbi:MAG: sugar ABC transporter permease [Clostridia bacterium]|nr:sugar ABC transporter permease [Clostridia bacterium]